MKFVKFLSEMSKEDVAIAGGKGASLAEMYNIGLPVPNAFVVTAQAYKYFLEKTKIGRTIFEILKNTDVNDNEQLQKNTQRIRELIEKTKMPEEIEKEIEQAYSKLSKQYGVKEEWVVARSSATAEDIPSVADSYIIAKVNGKLFLGYISELFNYPNGLLEIPVFLKGKVLWAKAGIYKHYVNTKMYKVKLKSGKSIMVTPDHSLITLSQNLKPYVVSVHELSRGSLIPTIRRIEIESKSDALYVDQIFDENGVRYTIINGDLYVSSRKTQENKIPKHIKLDSDICYFLGLFLAEGTVYKNQIIVTSKNEKIRKRALLALKKIGLNAKDNGIDVKINSAPLAKLLNILFFKEKKGVGKGSNVKKISKYLFEIKDDLKIAFIAGYFDGDGWSEGGRIVFSTKFENLANDMVYFLSSIGIISFLNSDGKYWDIIVPKKYVFKIADSLNNFSLKFRLSQKSLELDSIETYNFGLKDLLLQKFGKERKIKICPKCSRKVDISSPYKNKNRFHCKKCHKMFYEEDLLEKTEIDISQRDDAGRFLSTNMPHNIGTFKGSERLLMKKIEKYGINELKEILFEDVFWDRVEDVEEVDYEGFVYDFVVPFYENFLANGIFTHNTASFAGQQATMLNIKGAKNVVKAVKQCWASLFTARATFYRASKGFDHSKVLIAVPVQKQLDSEKAGVGFTIHPSTGEKDKIMIEGSWGQGESVVSGAVTPDTYVLDKKTGELLQVHIAKKLEMRILDKKKGGLKVVKVPKNMQNKRVLTNDELQQLYKLAIKLEKHYKVPQDFEWVVEKGKVYLVQARPVTVFYEKKEKVEVEEKVKPILEGLPASPGIAHGIVKIVKSPKELGKIKQGDILVTKMTNPDYVAGMKRAVGIITDEGGQTSHAAIVSRELGVVCVVGTKEATKKLKDGNFVTIDGYNGKVYLGKVEIQKQEEKYEYVKTKTKVYINLGEPDLAEKYKDLKCDGVGLMRAEFMASEVGKHPKLLIKRGGDDLFINTFAKGIEKVAKAFYPRPVVYRALDFKTNEYADLAGGKRFEPHENNPMIGWRGASRYITEPEVFELELKAIKKVRDKGYDNVYLMIPFVRTTWELDEIKKIIDKVGLSKDKKFKLWIMVEVPSAAILIEEFCKKGIDGVSIGSNDLTQLILGVDRDSAILGKRWFNELDPAVLWAIERVVKTCKKYGVTCSICGQAPSVYPELTKMLVKWGITSVSVNPDVVDRTRHIVAEAEKGLLHKLFKK